jgi:sulfite reductase beta subunit-like hemoprotein
MWVIFLLGGYWLTTKSDKSKYLSPDALYQLSLELSKTSEAIIPYIDDEVNRFEDEVKAFRAGQVEEPIFMPFRLHHGVYGQRQENQQMMRIKIPGGILTPEALDALGRVTEKFAPLKQGHVTTRENIQVSHLKLEECSEVIRILGKAGLTTRDACANTVRNVVGPPMAGICPDELFDVTPYLAAYVRFAVRNPLTQNFPRKFKTSFSGCVEHDPVIAALHDLSYIASVRVNDGVEQRGFKVVLGGATSIMPRLGKVLYEFVPEEDYLRVAQAIWQVFNKADMLRKNKMMARIKVLIERIGFDAVKDMVDAELNEIGPIDPKPMMNVDEIHREEPPIISQATSNGHDGSEEFETWKKSNAVAQKQPNYYATFVKLPRGNITSGQFHALASLIREYTGGRARATQEQNLALRWVPEGNLYQVWKGLKEIGLAESAAHEITDVVSCPGTDSCKLGITSSMGLAEAIREELASWNGLAKDPLVNQIRIKMSGCPNGCSLHHAANIGFHGAAMKGPSGEQIPAYEVFIGGNYGGESFEATRFGKRIPRTKVPAKRVPQFIRQVASYYKKNRNNSETFNGFTDRIGLQPFEAMATALAQVGALGPETQELYTDWSKSETYKLERGEGECAA